jgi:hypothetical protein
LIIWEGVLTKKHEKYLQRWPSEDIGSMESLYKYALNHYTDQESY